MVFACRLVKGFSDESLNWRLWLTPACHKIQKPPNSRNAPEQNHFLYLMGVFSEHSYNCQDSKNQTETKTDAI